MEAPSLRRCRRFLLQHLPFHVRLAQKPNETRLEGHRLLLAWGGRTWCDWVRWVARQATAQGMLTTAHASVESAASEVESALRFGKSGAVCRRFVRTEFSPPQAEFDRIQREHNAQCAWFTQAF